MATEPRSANLLLVAYDGSDLSRQAIRHAGALLSGNRAVVLHVHEPVVPVPAPVGVAMVAPGPGVDREANEQPKLAAAAPGKLPGRAHGKPSARGFRHRMKWSLRAEPRESRTRSWTPRRGRVRR